MSKRRAAARKACMSSMRRPTQEKRIVICLAPVAPEFCMSRSSVAVFREGFRGPLPGFCRVACFTPCRAGEVGQVGGRDPDWGGCVAEQSFRVGEKGIQSP